MLRLVFIHSLVGLVYFTGYSKTALVVCALTFLWRAIFLSISYHRYFSHRSYQTSRAFQFFLALAGSVCMQRGALWWAANHRKHHQYSDTELDPHSPIAHGFWYAHIGWVMKKDSFITDYSRVRDFARFPELKWLNEKSDLVHAVFAASLFLLGEVLRASKPELQTSGFQLLIWGYLISGFAHLHTIFLVNSLTHLHGRRDYEVPNREGRDQSHNIGWLAYLTAGEGWHHNHHSFPQSARVGLRWWEFDLGWIVLKMLRLMGLVWELKTPSAASLEVLSRKPRPEGATAS